MGEYKYGIAIHGGAGTILREKMTADMEEAYKNGLKDALLTGRGILERGGSAMDAVEASVSKMENNHLFNAGKGSVFNHEGRHEMDAAIMDGKDKSAGSVCGLSGIKNPVKVCRQILRNSEHVMFYGEGAMAFAIANGFESVDDQYFYDQLRYDQYKEAMREDRVQLDHNDRKFGTVGAVALDRDGNLAAATSTGGMTNKQVGRVGDTPIIGSGTYADNTTCAISCTGHGELFMRYVVAHDVAAMMAYGGKTLKEASEEVVMKKLVAVKGEGGLIGIDRQGNISMPFNSEGMYRACVREDQEIEVKIYKD